MEENRPSEARRRTWALVIRATIAVAVLMWAFSQVEIDELADVLSSARPWPLLGALVSSVIFTGVVAVRLALLLRRSSKEFAYRLVWRVNLAAQFYGLFVPGGTLANLAIRYQKLIGRAPRGRTLVFAMLLDRLSGLAGIALVGALAWAISVGSTTVAVGVVTMSLAVGILPLLAPAPRGGQQGERSVARRIGSEDTRWRDVPWLFALAVAAQVPGVVAFLWVAQSVNIELSIATLIWIRSLALVASSLPISISGLGIREGVLLLALTERGVTDETALAFGVLVFGATIVGPALIGGVDEAWRFLVPTRHDAA